MLPLYACSIFLSAGLLFMVQPMFARLVLPLLGGSPAVWNTALVFYQAALLAGYGYAHLSTTRLGVRRQAVLHVAVLPLPLPLLPLALPLGWSPPTASNPTGWLLALLLCSVGLPFFVVSTTSPLLQKWFSSIGHGKSADPYFLYAASNLGSMLALLSYPAVAEPLLTLRQQTHVWSLGYVSYAVLMACCAATVWRRGGAGVAATPPATVSAVPWQRRMRWVALALVPSSLMLSVTTFLSTDIAAIPLFWVVPLALYLLTFIVAFAVPATPAGDAGKPGDLLPRALPFTLLPLLIAVATHATQPITLLIPMHLANFFVVALMCHGELARDRPEPGRLTEFYFWLAVGGVLGGSLNALVAPLMFHSLVEYPLMLVAACLVMPWPADRGRRVHPVAADAALPLGLALLTVALVAGLQNRGFTAGPAALAAMFGLPLVLCFSFSRRPPRFALGVAAILWAGSYYRNGQGSLLLSERSFFGVHRVMMDATGHFHVIAHGGIIHGLQNLDPPLRRIPLAYYHPTGPAGRFFRALDKSSPPRRVALVGLGAGALICYARPPEQWTFFEIDPVVKRIASDNRYFTYLNDSPVHPAVVLGDARLSLGHSRDGEFDVIVLDAYSSDAIPVHLITREAVLLYARKLSPHGLLLFNISNLHLDLEPVLGALAGDRGWQCLVKTDDHITARDAAAGKSASQWAVMARQARDLAPLKNEVGWEPARVKAGARVWTDDYSSVLSAFAWH